MIHCVTGLGDVLSGEPPLLHAPLTTPRTHLLPGTWEVLRDVYELDCRADGAAYHFSNGVLRFASPRGARVEVALLVDYVDVKVNDVVVATEIRSSEQVDHERLRETLEHAFHVLNGLAASVEYEREEKRRAAEEEIRRALDSL